MANRPDFYGDKKCELIDFLGETEDFITDYGESPTNIVIFLCKLFDVKPSKYIGKKRSKVVLSKFLREDSFDRNTFGYCVEMVTRGYDQDDIKRAKQVLGHDQYHELLGLYKNTIQDSDISVIANSSIFFKTPEWKRVRYQALRIYKNFCQCCGRKRSESLDLHVDHIIPKSIRPELALELSNLQILCADCNQGKDNIDATDWRDENSTNNK